MSKARLVLTALFTEGSEGGTVVDFRQLVDLPPRCWSRRSCSLAATVTNQIAITVAARATPTDGLTIVVVEDVVRAHRRTARWTDPVLATLSDHLRAVTVAYLRGGLVPALVDR